VLAWLDYRLWWLDASLFGNGSYFTHVAGSAHDYVNWLLLQLGVVSDLLKKGIPAFGL
jgi:hypothetical protein